MDICLIFKTKEKINKKIKIIEDCAQAFGAEMNLKSWNFRRFSCFSFHAQKFNNLR